MQITESIDEKQDNTLLEQQQEEQLLPKTTTTAANNNSSISVTINNKEDQNNKMDIPKRSGSSTTSSKIGGVNRKMIKSSRPKSTLLSVPSGGINDNASPLQQQQQHAYSNQIQIQTYISRMVDIQQMDIQSALDQMTSTLTIFTSPLQQTSNNNRIYKTSYYRKQTKNHWARDDPAYLVLQIFFLSLSSLAFCIAFRVFTMRNVLFILFHNIISIWLGCGIVICSLGRWISIQYLTVHQSGNHVKQYVEWLYAFDIHCNAFFPFFILLYVVQFFLLPFVLGKTFFALFLANTLYAVAFSIYFYVTHLGYRALPFLSNTEVFLFPIVGVLSLYLINLIGYPFGFGWNASRVVASFYFD